MQMEFLWFHVHPCQCNFDEHRGSHLYTLDDVMLKSELKLQN